MRILLVSPMTPYLPCHDGFRALVAQLVDNLARRHPVFLIAQGSPSDTPEQRRWAAPLCARTEIVEPGRWVTTWSGRPAEGLERMRQAMARAIDHVGTPLVASRRSLTGLAGVVPGQHLLVPDTEAEFANGVLALLENPARADALAGQARPLIERAYSWPVVAGRHEALLSRVAGAAPAQAVA